MTWRKQSSRSVLIVLLAMALGVLAACGPQTQTITSGFPTNAQQPSPKEITFQGCPPTGDGGDTQLNTLKNRIDDGVNGSFNDVALSTLLSLDYPQDVGRTMRKNWTQADQSAVSKYEGVAVRTTGYILAVKHEGTESTNCHAVDYRDFHVWLAESASDSKAKALVVEVTPRVRDQRSGWDDQTLSGLKGQQVRISGWLLFDQEHPEQLGQTRATLWEIHPIIHIEVSQGGGWQSID